MLVCGELEFGISQGRREDPLILRLAERTSVEPDDEGGPADGLVEVTFDDGTVRCRTSKEAPRTLLYHDEDTATSVFAERINRSGRSLEEGRAIASAIFRSAQSPDDVRVSQILDRIIGSNVRA
jgi:hypothetical protein